MNRLATERDILNEAIGAIHREAGLRLDVVGHEVRKGDKRIDAIIRIPEADNQLVAEIKKWAPHVNLGAVINQINHIAGPGQGKLTRRDSGASTFNCQRDTIGRRHGS